MTTLHSPLRRHHRGGDCGCPDRTHVVLHAIILQAPVLHRMTQQHRRRVGWSKQVDFPLFGRAPGVNWRPYLLHEPEVIPMIPDLDDLSVREAENVHTAERCGLPSCR